ncbi:MAG: superoxide dismutase family protein [Ginsengibacter sp.]
MKNVIQHLKVSACAIMMAFGMAACNGSSDTTVTSDSTATMSSDNMDTNASMNMSSDAMKEHAMAQLSGTNADTTVSGSAQFDAANGKVKMELELTIPKMANKSVAVHIHEMADCGDMGKAAGGHWNPTNAQHGKWGTGSFHSGDIGNVTLDGSGKGTMSLETDLWSLGGDAKTNILNRTVMVHSGTDDFTSQPSGNAGSRIGCGVIQ